MTPGQQENQDCGAHNPSLQPGILSSPSHNLKLSRILPGQRSFVGTSWIVGEPQKGELKLRQEHEPY